MKDNELIAEFMGGKKSKRGQDTVFYFTPDFKGSGFWHNEYLPFDRSWGWLIPVVEKIRSTGHIVEISFHSIVTCHINQVFTGKQHTPILCEQSGDTSIEPVYRAVVKFIKWHNGNNL